MWKRALGSGAQLLWRTKSDHRLPIKRRLDDGSFLSELYAASDRRREQAIEVRVIEYELDDLARPSSETRYRLLSSILDPDLAPVGAAVCTGPGAAA